MSWGHSVHMKNTQDILGVVFIYEQSLTARVFALQQKVESQMLFPVLHVGVSVVWKSRICNGFHHLQTYTLSHCTMKQFLFK